MVASSFFFAAFLYLSPARKWALARSAERGLADRRKASKFTVASTKKVRATESG
jgi:hypothetical protein